VRSPASLLLLHGRVYTADPARPWAQALAIRDDTILAVGSDGEAEAYRGTGTREIDLGGRMVMPGIVDSHTHVLIASESRSQADMVEAKTLDEIGTIIREHAAAHPADPWVRGFGWMYGLFPTPDGLPTRQILDELVPDRPALMLAFDAHSSWANSRALAAAGITRDTPDPTDNGVVTGAIVRDPATGEPTGVLKEAAMVPARNAAPELPRERLIGYLAESMAEANRRGITTAVNASGSIHELELYAELHRQGSLTVRMCCALGEVVGVKHHSTPEELAIVEDARRRFTGDWVRGGLVKLFVDGVMESHSAALLAPYANLPHACGETVYTPEELHALCLELDRRTIQVMAHAVGDRAVRTILDAYEAVARTNGPRDRRFRVEHIETVSTDDVPRFASLGVIASMQPLHGGLIPEDPPWQENTGEARWSTAFRWFDLAASGAMLAFGSDWPVVTLDPFAGIQAALTRQTPSGEPPGGWFPEQRLVLDQALLAYTRDAGYAAFFDDRIGTLAPGKLADLLVLSQNLFEIPSTAIANTRILLTMVGGRIVWQDGI
jgi:predicted amidohydrolase YtcJ